MIRSELRTQLLTVSHLPLDLGFVGLPGCQLLVSLDQVYATSTKAVSPGKGVATFETFIPSDLSLVGTSVYVQWLVRNPPNSPTWGATTRGLEITFQLQEVPAK